MNISYVTQKVSNPAAEKQVVATVWRHVEQLLIADRDAAEAFVRGLMAVLPDPAAFTSEDLHDLARLHVGSAQNFLTTMRLLVPEAFSSGSTRPDPAMLDVFESAALGVIAVLVELQLFHMQRAAVLTAVHRRRLAAQAAAHAVSSSSAGSSEGGDSGCSDCHRTQPDD